MLYFDTNMLAPLIFSEVTNGKITARTSMGIQSE